MCMYLYIFVYVHAPLYFCVVYLARAAALISGGFDYTSGLAALVCMKIWKAYLDVLAEC